MQNSWLQGGPFLQASFIQSFCGDRYRAWAVDTIKILEQLLKPLEIALSPDELDAQITSFEKGYATGFENTIGHTLRLPIYINVSRKRRAEFVVDKASSTLLQVQFWFYGSQSDVPSWHMIGVTEKEFPQFKEIVLDLFRQFKFDVATLGYEMDTLDLFSSEKGWPDESYHLGNLNSRKLKDFEMVVCRKGIFDSEAKTSGKPIEGGYIFERDFLPLPI